MKHENSRRGAHEGASRPRLIRILGAVFALVFIVSAGFFLSTVIRGRQEQSAFEELAAQKPAVAAVTEAAPEETEAAAAEAETPETTSADDADERTAEAEAEQTRLEMIAWLEELRDLNGDFAGWLCISGTDIDYPVMLTPEEPEYYLHRGFDGEKSSSGTPFVAEGCTTESDNLLIYGHNMKNGTMFAGLLDYEDEEFYSEHSTIFFDTPEALGQYEIIAAFREKVHTQDETGVFRFYDYGGELTEERFDEYISQVKAAALYDTGVTAEYGDRLLTLATCAYHTGNGRFVVVARLVS